MLQSKLFPHTLKNPPKDEQSASAILLTRAGYTRKLMAGVYSYLPLGLVVFKKIYRIIEEEMVAIGGQALYMPALQPKELWDKTGRWTELKDVMYQFADHSQRAIGLAATHEEVLAEIVRSHVTSYRDLPLYLFQIQDKFRDEPRAKSGLLRGREFSMKDLYSFHEDEKDLLKYYQKVIAAYKKIFTRCGLQTIITEASGGSFSKEYSHEFQVLSEAGEDKIIYCPKKDFGQNQEIAKLKEGDACPNCGTKLKFSRAIEVGNIFKLGTKYSAPLDATYLDRDGKKQPIVMGSYGIGLGRLMATIVETHHDTDGIMWPKELTPFHVHLLDLHDDTVGKKRAKKIYESLKERFDVLFDDRPVSFGVKLKDADLIGISVRLISSDKTGSSVELRFRERKTIERLPLTKAIQKIAKFYGKTV